MMSLEERKLALLIQTQQLRTVLDSLKQQDYKESQLCTYTGRKAYVGLMDLMENLNSNRK